ncbi:PP2C family protein-serine/threonine phosphatase [Leptospira licerasiae]|uniref:Stage II sporulation protein E n=1 Tax=Leptospira licerasiae str. MMD4847 TaxID=1049971 RepID=A0ABP2RBA2_9LEPT|nr:SpoIIE family protein phosphatase [Leptospira licerasiae]EID99624.1 response regulator receiver domain / stage II sporulation protein E multi-domain protein [Leptospira licerasiae serovar Varillal str. VAR 010]EJZ41668.1 stage II sporulation protein E [Leptospira licerasiae str. MMD4847]
MDREKQESQLNYSDYSILAVDDSDINLKLLVHTLKPLGFQVFTAMNTEEARTLLATNQVDVLLLDVSMPGQDGFSFCKELREIDRFNLLPILFITAYNRELGFDEAIAHGGDDFLHKPFQPKELVAKIRAFIRIKNLQDELLQQKKKYEKELVMARRVQQELVPEKQLEWNGFKVNSVFHPLMQIGGDFIDAWIEEDKLHVFIADCSGHGPSAALLSAMVKMQVSNLGRSNTLIEKVKTLRQQLEKILPEDFSITFFYGILDKKGNFEYANGGHPPPLLYHNGNVDELPGMGPLIIPIELGTEDEFRSVVLEKGASLLLYTDGATEITDENYNILGEESLKKILKDAVESKEDILNFSLEKILAHSGNMTHDDDIALMVIQG